ncbi:P protein [Microtus ochrogaster]|uniref:P protein n=1 Tax=Microtus ochrogaster TaxID=79684 RepID=A0A8J6FWH2_MICOH|nr:P protein [Microtus ochrogaster]
MVIRHIHSIQRGIPRGIPPQATTPLHATGSRREGAQQSVRTHSPLAQFSSSSKDLCFKEDTPLLWNSSQDKRSQFMSAHRPEFIATEDSWENGLTAWEQRCVLGKEVADMSMLASSEKGFLAGSVHLRVQVSTLGCCVRWMKVTGLFVFVVVCSVSTSISQTCYRISVGAGVFLGGHSTSVNLSGHVDSAMLQLDLAGPLMAGGPSGSGKEEHIVVVVTQADPMGSRRRRPQATHNWTVLLNPRSEHTLVSRTFEIVSREAVSISIQASLQQSRLVPLLLAHQFLGASVEAQVTIAVAILTGVYTLIIFESSDLAQVPHQVPWPILGKPFYVILILRLGRD